MITERTLRQWRRDALKGHESQKLANGTIITGELYNVAVLKEIELNSRILRLTQELLDHYLLRKA